MSIYRILIEGGGETIAKALEAGVVNEFLLFIGPKLIGGRDAKTPVEGLGSALVSNATKVRDVKVRSIGQDILITGRIN